MSNKPTPQVLAVPIGGPSTAPQVLDGPSSVGFGGGPGLPPTLNRLSTSLDVLAVCQAQSTLCVLLGRPHLTDETTGVGGMQVGVSKSPHLPTDSVSQSVFGPGGEWRPPRKRQRLDLNGGIAVSEPPELLVLSGGTVTRGVEARGRHRF